MRQAIKMSDAVKRLNAEKLEAAGIPVDLPPEAEPGPPKEFTSKRDQKVEKELQRNVENWLGLHGYRRRTPDLLKGDPPEKGYFIHLNQTKKNPILLDLLILGNDGAFLELELKIEGGSIRPAQKYLIETWGGVIAYSYEKAIETIQQWEQENERKRKCKKPVQKKK